MECREVLARYSEFLDDGLKSGKREEIEKHIEFCERCNAYQKILSDGLMAYRELAKPKLSDDFYLRLQHRLFHLKEVSRGKRRANVLIRGIVPTLSASIVFFITAFLFSSQFRLSDGPGKAAAVRNQTRDEKGFENIENDGGVEEALLPVSTAPQGEKRDWDKKFVRNNIWRFLVEPPTNLFVGGGPASEGGIRTVGREDAFPVRVSTVAPDRPGNLDSLDNSRYVGLGVSVVPVEFQVGGEQVREVKRGLRVLRVKQMTPAHIAGILPGDTIVGIDHIPIEGPEELSQLVFSFAYQTKSIQIYRLGRLIELYVDL